MKNQTKNKEALNPRTDREALHPETIIYLYPYDANLKEVVTSAPVKELHIKKLIGAGSTSLAYYAYDPVYKTNYILKECYPANSNIIRNEQKIELTGDGSTFEQAKRRFLDSYNLSHELYYKPDYSMDFVTSAPLGFFSANETFYSAYLVREGVSYNKRIKNNQPFDNSITELLLIILQLSNAIMHFHKKNYLYLDIREDNIFVLGCGADYGTARGILLFDFDSMVCINEIRERINNHTLRFSAQNKPPELQGTITDNEIGIQTDHYQIAALLYQRLCEGKCYNGRIDLPNTGLLSNCNNQFYVNLKKFLENTLNDRIYKDDESFIKDLKELYSTAYHMENPGIDDSHAIDRNLLRTYAQSSFKDDADNKFKSLASLKVVYNNHIRMCSSDSTDNEELVPYDVLNSNRLIFLVGDGGIGKSTLLQTYRQSKLDTSYSINEITPFYIELHRYNYERHNFAPSIDSIATPHSDWIPFHLLCRINNNEIPPKGSELYAKIQNQYNGLDALFSRCYTLGFQYSILLDGFNEVPDYLKSSLLEEIQYYANRWKGVQFVVTSRKLPDEFKNKSQDVIFSAYNLLGLNKDEIEKAFKESTYSEAAIKNAINDDKLMSILHIPLFLNLFLGTNENFTKSIRTRGEILDAFITSKTKEFYNESITAQRTINSNDNLFRKFLLDYLLPFVGSYADKYRVFTIVHEDILNCLENGYNILLNNSSIDIPATETGYTQFNIQSLNEIFSTNNETSRKKRSYNKLLKKTTFNDNVVTYLIENAAYLVGTKENGYEFSHQYFKDYFAAKQIVNVLTLANTLQKRDTGGENQLEFIHQICNLDYNWSDDVCILLGEIIGDYKNEPGYTEE